MRKITIGQSTSEKGHTREVNDSDSKLYFIVILTCTKENLAHIISFNEIACDINNDILDIDENKLLIIMGASRVGQVQEKYKICVHIL